MSPHEHNQARERLRFAFLLNASFTVIELVGAYLTNSTAIAADALHDLGDSLSLAFSWAMEGLAGRRADPTYTYGFRRLSLLGALVNAIVLLAGGVIVLTHTIPRLFDPVQPDAQGMIGLAILGVVVNGAAAMRVRAGQTLNERVVSLHLMEDLGGWVVVLIVSIVMVFVDLPILDPLLSVAFTLWVGMNAVRRLKETFSVFLQAVPEGVDIDALREVARGVPGVRDLLHLHVWSEDAEHHVLTAQLWVEPMSLEEAIAARAEARSRLEGAGIEHVTLELGLEPDPEP